MNATEACIALNMLPTVGPVRLRRLLEVFKEPQRILAAKRNDLRKIEGIGSEVADQISDWESTVDLDAELDRVREFGATVITQGSPSYPKPLREIHAPPIVLYVWGELQQRDHHAIGIIGARRTTHYGVESAKKLAYQLAYAGLTVISGLARGIDTAAHQGALAAKGRTIAVIGSGLARLYPPENAALAEKIRAGNGAIVSEFSMEIEPDRQTFPMRNRIISGWSHGVLVVEAGLNSGALITASQALEQGRSVYAVPGHINAPSAIGSNRLIQQGAKLVMDASDVLDDLQILLPETKPSPEAAARPLPLLSEYERLFMTPSNKLKHRLMTSQRKKSAEWDGFIDSVAIRTEAFGQAIARQIFCKAGINITLHMPSRGHARSKRAPTCKSPVTGFDSQPPCPSLS